MTSNTYPGLTWAFVGEKANFDYASFKEKANFESVSFKEKAHFGGVRFNGEAYFWDGSFNGNAYFDSAVFNCEAYFVSARFNGEAIFGSDFGSASFNGGVDFSTASLEKVSLRNAVLTNSKFIDTNLKDAILTGVDLTGSQYEPYSSTYQGSLGGIKGLKTVWFNMGQQGGLVQLRAALKESGLRDLEREATYSIEHWKAHYQPWYKKWIKRILFEWTCGYGLYYLRPLVILLGLILVFSLPYIIALETHGQDGIWKVWVDDRARRDLGEQKPERIKLRGLPVLMYGFYFSILSAFHIGWRDLNVGSWISRIQPREYTLKATGWVRVVSGVQSLISIYLLALWVLTQFGRPFD